MHDDNDVLPFGEIPPDESPASGDVRHEITDEFLDDVFEQLDFLGTDRANSTDSDNSTDDFENSEIIESARSSTEDNNREDENVFDGDNTPEHLPQTLLPVPALEIELLPDSPKEWLTDIAERMQCPLEFPCVAALICIAALIGNKLRIRPNKYADWTVTVNLWGAVVGKPGGMKTPALDEALKLLKSIERAANEEFSARLRELEFSELERDAKRGALKSEIKKAVKQNIDVKGLMTDFLDLDAGAIAARRYIVNDSTIEKIVELLAENPNGLLLYRDELMGLIRSFDRDGRQQDRQFFLEAWSGSVSYTSDRIVRGKTRVENLTVSILGGIQPAPLSAYLNAAIAGNKYDDGFIQRFQLLVYPDLSPNWKKIDRPPNESAAKLASRIFARLDSLAATDISASVDGTTAYLRFSGEAQPFFDCWYEALEHKLRGNHYEHPAIEAHFAKYRSLMPSLALIFHLVETAAGEVADSSSVSLAAARKAAEWCDFLEQHAFRIYGMALNGNSQMAAPYHSSFDI